MTIDIDTVAGPWQIVGIVRDTKSGDPRSTEAGRMTYIPLAQIAAFVPPAAPDAHGTSGPAALPEENQDRFAGTILVRTTGDAAGSIADLRAAVAAVDPNLPLLHVATIHEEVSRLMTHDELISSLTRHFFAAGAGAGGDWAVRGDELQRGAADERAGDSAGAGAQTRSLLWMVLGESLMLLGMGMAFGLPLTLAATRMIRQQLFGLSALDPLTFALAMAIVSSMTLLAAWLPARRATRVDPMVALRCD